MQTESLVNRVKLAMLTMQRASWEQGVAAQALLELGEIDLVVLMAREAALRQLPDGRLAGLGSEIAVTDPAANGVPVLYAARYTGEAALKTAAQRMLDYLMHTAPRTKDGVLHHRTDVQQVWVDSYYMAPPFLAVAGQPAVGELAQRGLAGHQHHQVDLTQLEQRLRRDTLLPGCALHGQHGELDAVHKGFCLH